MASLKKYRARRRFDVTPEPRGLTRRAKGALRFVVQKHQATRLHYDFRLECAGVLKSWAVPKGPSLNPDVKRLAIMVEDHPLDYRTFEGVIPEGYGAGTVMVWDEGDYQVPGLESRAEIEKAVTQGLAAGRLTVTLNGSKLRGQFTLVRLARGKANEWLLVKKRDASANIENVLAQEESVLSQRTLAEIAQNDPVEDKAQGQVAALKREKKPSRFIKPMLATAVTKPFDRPGWLFEVKWDGYRAIAEVEDGRVRLYSRNGLSFESKFAAVAADLRKLRHDVILDGEIVALDHQGRAIFSLLQNYQKTGKGRLVYYVFDLLERDGENLRSRPLRERKQILAPVIKGLSHVRLSEHVEEQGIALFQASSEQGIEGIVAKDGASPYREGQRGLTWLKVKSRRRQEAVIAGFTRPRGGRTDLGAVVLGVYEKGALTFVGQAGSGFTSQTLGDVRRQLQPLVRQTCPFKKRPPTNAPVRWVEPRLVCEVAFQEWTEDGIMRFPIFLGLRPDKPAEAVEREMPIAVPDSRPGKTSSSPIPAAKKVIAKPPRTTKANPHPTGPVKLTNLNKVFWPEEGYTKGDLLAYYQRIAPFILPHLKDRPLSLHRHPNGIYGHSFFQKDMSRQPPPPWVQTTPIPSETNEKPTQYMVCQDEPSLLYAVNLGCIELNTWNSRIGSLDKPDYLVIDLDPQDVPFTEVVEAAKGVRALLEKHCAPCYCKTSGKTGLHVYIPLGARYDNDVVRQFAELVARLVHRQLPDSTSLMRSPAQRRRRIYLDYLQNRRGQTMAAAYSVRPVPGAWVSTPLRWTEVTRKLDPSKFTLETMPHRLDQVGDLWQPLLGPGPDLAVCLRQMTAG